MGIIAVHYRKVWREKQDKTEEKAQMGVDSMLNTSDTKCDSARAST